MGTLEHLPLSAYLDGTSEAQDMEWSVNLSLPEGTVLLLSHPRTERACIFESLEPGPNKTADGLLTILHGVEAVPGEERIEAHASLQHVAPFLSKQNTPYVEFRYKDREGTTHSIIPPLHYEEVMYSEQLAQEARERRITKELETPFHTATAQEILRDLVRFYSSSASLNEDPEAALLMQAVAQQLRSDFLHTKVD